MAPRESTFAKGRIFLGIKLPDKSGERHLACLSMTPRFSQAEHAPRLGQEPQGESFSEFTLAYPSCPSGQTPQTGQPTSEFPGSF